MTRELIRVLVVDDDFRVARLHASYVDATDGFETVAVAHTAADAVRFAIEELPEPQLLGATIEIDEERLGHKDICALYESEHYPLKKAN